MIADAAFALETRYGVVKLSAFGPTHAALACDAVGMAGGYQQAAIVFIKMARERRKVL